MRWSGRADLLDEVMKHTIPMRGRMIHGKSKSGILTEEAQDYDIHGRVCLLVFWISIKAHCIDKLRMRPRRPKRMPTQCVRSNAQRQAVFQPQACRRRLQSQEGMA